jgi:hypothetical protein
MLPVDPAAGQAPHRPKWWKRRSKYGQHGGREALIEGLQQIEMIDVLRCAAYYARGRIPLNEISSILIRPIR